MTATPVRDSATTTDAGPGPRPADRMPTPRPRGPVSAALLAVLTAGPPRTGCGTASCPTSGTASGTEATRPAALRRAVADALAPEPDVLGDADLQLALTVLYELHHRGVDGVDDAWEWEPELLAVRQSLEAPFEAALRTRAAHPPCAETDAAGVARWLFDLTASDGGPRLARYVARRADAAQARELLVLRSLYQLREADPHTWAVPRLAGAPKAALVEIQADEYGGGRPGRMHAELFARTMRGAGLDDAYGRYVDVVPTEVLVALNTMSLFGLHRRLRGAIVGHLAAFEMTSSIPSRLYADGFRRLGHDPGTTEYFDEHVEADAVHEQIAGRDLAGRLAEQEPALRDDVLFGAAACLAVEGDVAAHALRRWRQGDSALLAPLDDPADARA